MKTQTTDQTKLIYFIILLALGGLQALVASNQNANEETLGGYCAGPDTRVCKITDQGTTVYGDWVENQIISN